MIVRRVVVLFCTFVCLVSFNLFAGPVGDENAVQVISFTAFPAADSDNKLGSFGFFKNGFSLEDETTTCTFASVFPVSGDISLHGGQLCLDTDMICQNVTNLSTSGFFLSNNHVLDLCESITGLPVTHDSLFHNTKIYLSSDLQINGTAKFYGNCIIDGRHNRIILGSDGHIILSPGASLKFKNLELDGVSGNHMWCTDDSGSITLDNMRWVQDADYSFTNGSMKILNTVSFAGPYTFYYDSTHTSTIDSDSCWCISDIGTLSLGRKTGIDGREPLYFEDVTSILKMENSTLSVTSSGACFTNGTMLGDGEVRFVIDSTSRNNALKLGSGVEANDFTFRLYPEAVFSLVSGHMVYDIIDKSNFLTDDVDVKFIRQASNSYFYADQDVTFRNITVQTEPASTFIVADGKDILFDNAFVDSTPADYLVTATRTNTITNLLAGDGAIFLYRGNLPLNITVQNSGNSLGGQGNYSGLLTLQDSNAELSLDLTGRISSNITMNEGTITLLDDLSLARGVCLTGSGTIVANDHIVNIDPYTSVYSGTIRWEGDGAEFRLNSDTTLASEMTFSGDWVVNGNGNILDLAYSGSIVIAKDSRVTFKNIGINGLQGTNIRCFDDSSQILFDDTQLYLEGDYSFTVGSFIIRHDVDLSGTYTFFYESVLTSSFCYCCHLNVCKGATFSVGRADGYYGREPIYFPNNNSEFILDNATLHITPSGMNITRGRFLARHDVTIDIETTCTMGGLMVGDGAAGNDMICEWNAGSVVHVPRGHLIYNNVSPTNFTSKTKNTRFDIGEDFNLYLKRDMQLQNLQVETCTVWGYMADPGKILSYNGYTVLYEGSEYEITGMRYNDVTNLLAGNHSIVIKSGALPLATVVMGPGNRIYGIGSIGQPVFLVGDTAELTLDNLGDALANIDLGGGTLILSQPLLFDVGNVLTGQGTVNCSNYFTHFGGPDFVWTSTVCWDCNRGGINLDSQVNLTSRWTFSGDAIIEGQNRIIDMSFGGQILVERGSTLTLRDVKIKGLSGDCICCTDDAGKIIFDSVSLVQDSNMTFSVGSFEVLNNVTMMGDAKFSYQSRETSVVNAFATLTLDEDFEFSYEPPIASRALFKFGDSTSKLMMDGATLISTSTGLQLTKGNLLVKGACNIASDASCKAEGVILGDGVSVDSDVDIDIFPDAELNVQSGYVRYRNVS